MSKETSVLTNPASNYFNFKCVIAIFLLTLLFASHSAFAFKATVAKTTAKVIATLIENSKALADDEIIRLSQLSDEIGGTKKIGDELGKLNLPEEVLEDAYIRIALYQGKISRSEAEGMFQRLANTDGFRTTLRKIIGNNPNGTKGHLNELRIADDAAKNGYEVVSIGKKFDDGLKKGLTDIDIVLKKNDKTFIIEAKDYGVGDNLDIINYRKDLDTLIAYQKTDNSDAIPIFSMTNKPTDPKFLKLLQYEADKRNIQLIFGDPQEQIEQIKMLEKIL